MRLTLILVALLWASSTTAGAWLREAGTGFLATSTLHSADGGSDAALYFEYGVRPKLTLGVKIDASMVAGRVGSGSGFAFARRAIPTGKRPYKLAYEIGLGATLGDTTDPLLRTGLSYGRGLSIRQKNGWLALDLAVEWALSGAAHTAKFDTTFGLGITDVTKLMMQVFVSDTAGTTSLTLAPSLIWQPREKRPSYQIGLEAEQGDVSLRLGLWQEF